MWWCLCYVNCKPPLSWQPGCCCPEMTGLIGDLGNSPPHGQLAVEQRPSNCPPDPNSVLQKYCQYLVCWCKLASIDGRENGRWQEAKATICDRPRCLCGQRQPVASAHHPPCCWDQLGLQGDDGECKEAVDHNGESYGGDAARWPRPWARSHGESFLQDLFFFQCKLICYVSRIERQEYIWLYPAQYLNMVKAWHLNPVQCVMCWHDWQSGLYSIIPWNVYIPSSGISCRWETARSRVLLLPSEWIKILLRWFLKSPLLIVSLSGNEEHGVV